MAVTEIDLDEDTLREAMRLSDARTKKETVDLALREYVARCHRIQKLEEDAAARGRWGLRGVEPGSGRRRPRVGMTRSTEQEQLTEVFDDVLSAVLEPEQVRRRRLRAVATRPGSDPSPSATY